jgi:hypothetical protein
MHQLGRPGVGATGRHAAAAADQTRLARLNRQIRRATDPREPWEARKHAARWAASLAERCGLWRRPGQCEACGARCKLTRHHACHALPLVVVYLCDVCHRRADRRQSVA